MALSYLKAMLVLLAACLLQYVSADDEPSLGVHFNSVEEIAQYVDSHPEIQVQHIEEDSPGRRANEVSDLPYNGTLETSNHVGRGGWNPVRMKFVYRLDKSRSARDKNYLTNKLVPAVANVIGSAISPKRRCPPFSAPDIEGLPAPPGVHNTDMLFVVWSIAPNDKSSQFCKSESIIASALWLAWSPNDGRPLYGLIIFCKFSPSTYDMDLQVGTHEVLHALGFAPGRFLRGGAGFDANHFVRPLNGRPHVVSPRVTEFMKAHFDCKFLYGAPLEDDGGEGSSAVHWESRLFESDLMSYAIGPQNQHTFRNALSVLTLAYMEDTGWYNVNYQNVGTLSYGFKSGCPLVKGTYARASRFRSPRSRYYLCDARTQLRAPMCMHDGSAVGFCFNQWTAYDNFAQVNVIGAFSEGLRLECQGIQTGSRCLAQKNVFAYRYNRSKLPSCRKMSCRAGKVLVNGRPCATTLGKQGWDCPDNQKYCRYPGWLTCIGRLNDCSRHGDCHQGRCYCHVGWGGPKCDKPVCGSRCPNGSPCPASGFCGVAAKRVSFEQHIQRIYRVNPKDVPRWYKGLAAPKNWSGTGSDIDSSSEHDNRDVIVIQDGQDDREVIDDVQKE